MACRILVLLALMPLLAAKKPSLPRFKWGQSKEQIYLSVMVRDLDRDSVEASLPSPGEFRFRAKTVKGEEYALDLELREDVKVSDNLKWELAARSDKWGTATFCILNKANEHRWDLLVTEPKKYKNLLDKDWTREDQKLEPEEELPYVEDNSQYLMALTSKNKQKTLEKFGTVLVNVRYPWCSQCKSQDDAFIKAAKAAKAKGKKDAKWKKVAFAVLDAREERKLARDLGAKCDYTCEYRVYTDPKEEPETLKAQWSETELLSHLEKRLTPAVQILKDPSEAAPLKQTNTTCLGRFASEASPEFAIYKKVARLMRGQAIFAATSGEAAPLELWPHKQNFSFKFEGSWQDNGTVLHEWVKPRSIPLLQEYDWQLRETYVQLNLPLAKIWIDDKDQNPSFDKIVRHAVRRTAKRFIGKIAFVEVKKSTYSYELRDFGLNQPEVYPAFGIASNASYDALKYGFDITTDVAESAEAFWRDADKASDKLVSFCEQVLAGTWPQAHESAALQTNWTKGAVKKLVWKSYKEITSPEKPLLLELYGKYRADHPKKEKEAQHLATVLDGVVDSFAVASYDTGDNYIPPADFTRAKYSSDTEWYWVPAKAAGSERAPIIKLTKPKKDAPIKKVLEFALKQSGATFIVDELLAKHEILMVEDPPPATPAPSMGDMGGAGGMGGMMGDLGGMGGAGGMGDLAAMADKLKGKDGDMADKLKDLKGSLGGLGAKGKEDL